MESVEARARELLGRLLSRFCAGEPNTARATYRLQFSAGFTFRQAEQLIDYLDRLGVGDVYASPVFRPQPGSPHGYDIVDHNTFNPAVGTSEEFARLTDELRRRGHGFILDVVPNHMGVGQGTNSWWNDILENGPGSRYAAHFDVSWKPLKPELENRVLLPILGDHYGRVLERGELKLHFEQGSFFVTYYDKLLPVGPRTSVIVLEPLLPALMARLGETDERVLELQSIITGLEHLPPRTETKRSKVSERQREKEILKRRLAALAADSPEVAEAIADEVTRLNGREGDPHSFDTLDLLLEAQAYRLSYWRVASEEINYRRFFDVNDLAAIRMENPAVFVATHQLLFQLLGEERVTGVRVDHPDGLWDPREYLAALQKGMLLALARREIERDTNLGAGDRDRVLERMGALYERLLDEHGANEATCPLYIVVEKILARGEILPLLWPVDGSSGYDFLTSVGELFVDQASEAAMSEIYAQFTGERSSFPALAYDAKKLIIRTALASEFNVLTHYLYQIAARKRHSRDFTLSTLRATLLEFVAALPVYRTYVTEGDERMKPQDRRVVDRALRMAQRRNPLVDPSAFDFLRAILTLDLSAEATTDERARARDFVMRLQQYTGSVAAKGIEDTAFYRYHRLVSLNEVGGEPERFGIDVDEFHRQNLERLSRWPLAMTATSTHDTKRSEDVRARIHVLSELPEAWRETVRRVSTVVAEWKSGVEGEVAPSANEEYLFYQTIIGTLPLPLPANLDGYRQRMIEYMRKATKEAKVNTSWTNSSPDYDLAVESFVRRFIDAGSPGLELLMPLLRQVAVHGMWNSLSQVLLKLTSPGIPDIYQGCELWDFSLVDPDNRRPVDYAVRQAMLDELSSRLQAGTKLALAREALAHAEDGRIKLLVTHIALDCRRRWPSLYGATGRYQPLPAEGLAAAHLMAFARHADGADIISVAPRLTVRLTGGSMAPPVGRLWEGTSLPARSRRYRDLFTDRTLEVRQRGGKAMLLADEILAELPVALLESLDE